MNLLKYIFLVCIIPVANLLSAQLGGKSAYHFLELPANARLTSMGGISPGVIDEDVSFGVSNPASIQEKMHNQLSFSHNFHVGDINYGYIGYGRHISKYGISSQFGIQYINYGTFDYANVLGIRDGTFSVSETAFIIGASKEIMERLTFGTNIKTVFSDLESYQSIGLVGDLGLNYQTDSSRTVLSFVLKNIGTELTTYAGERFGTPFDVHIAFTRKLKYIPLRYSIVGHQLHRLDAVYDDPNATKLTDIFGNPLVKSSLSRFTDNLFRHLILNAELFLGKSQNLRLGIGYNHMRRKEMSLNSFRSLAGFSFGVGIKVKSFRLDYGRGINHIAGGTHHITIHTNLNRILKPNSREI